VVLVVDVETDEQTGTFAATSPEFPDVLAVGMTKEDAITRLVNAVWGHLDFLRDRRRGFLT
jgi:predicted RNase H-like HicB family nuclease